MVASSQLRIGCIGGDATRPHILPHEDLEASYVDFPDVQINDCLTHDSHVDSTKPVESLSSLFHKIHQNSGQQSTKILLFHKSIELFASIDPNSFIHDIRGTDMSPLLRGQDKSRNDCPHPVRAQTMPNVPYHMDHKGRSSRSPHVSSLSFLPSRYDARRDH